MLGYQLSWASTIEMDEIKGLILVGFRRKPGQY